MPVERLKKFLDRNDVRYVSIIHSPAYTAQEIAALTHTKGKELAKTVMVKIDGRMAMAVLPASFQLDLDRLAEVTGTDRVELAAEKEFKGLFGECEVGAMPPFGNLYEMVVYADEKLAEDEEIAFNAGRHTELVRLAYADFLRLVEPKVASLSAVPVMA